MLKRFTTIVGAVLVIAAVTVFLLILRQNKILRHQVGARVTSSVRFVPGDRLERLSLVDLTGHASVFDLRQARRTVAIVETGCGSCAKTIASARGTAGLVMVSLATPDATRIAAAKYGLAPFIFTLAPRGTPALADRKLHLYPQLMVVDHGVIVRTCLDLDECRN